MRPARAGAPWRGDQEPNAGKTAREGAVIRRVRVELSSQDTLVCSFRGLQPVTVDTIDGYQVITSGVRQLVSVKADLVERCLATCPDGQQPETGEVEFFGRILSEGVDERLCWLE